jgi:hypothetical protein
MIKKITISLFSFLLFAQSIHTQPAKRVLIDKEIEVLRADTTEFHFLVRETEKMQFKGSFKTSGGFNDDINLFVLTQSNYVKWYSKYPCEYALRINKKKDGRFTIDAISGETYYFVFENFFSTVSNKKVKVKLELVPAKSNK